MKKILLPTDFSKNSWNAISYALQLFKDDVCHFYLVNTYTPVIYNVEFMEVGTAQYGLIDAMKNTSQKGLDAFEAQIEKTYPNPKHQVTKISAFNTLTTQMSLLTAKYHIDYIVMGTKGATGAAEILFGSNTMHVINHAKCPVLAIPSDFKYETPKNVLFPSDYEVDFKENHLKPLLHIATLHASNIHLLNASFGYDLSENQLQNKHTLDAFFKNIPHDFHSVSNQTVEDAIAKFQIKHNIHLLVMINNKHSFFENLFFRSTINHIGFHLNIPFLVIPSKIFKQDENT